MSEFNHTDESEKVKVLETENRLLQAIHAVDKKVTSLETTISQSVTTQFRSHDRRITALEAIVKWVSVLIVGAVITALLALVIT